jgi:hypothetical protein
MIPLLFLLLFLCLSAGEVFYVKPEDGECSDNMLPCYKLDYYFNNSDIFILDDSIFYFLNGTHMLNGEGLVMIANVSNVTLQGLGAMKQGVNEMVIQSTVELFCTERMGIHVEDSTDIKISGLTFRNCGGAHQSDIFYSLEYNTLRFISVSNVTIERVSVLDGTGIGLQMENTYGISIRDSSFYNNHIPPCIEEVICPGGNLFITYFGETRNDTETNIEIIRSNFSFGYTTSILAGAGIAVMVNIYHVHLHVNILIDNVITYGNTALVAPNIQIGLCDIFEPSLCTNGISYNIIVNNTISSYGNGIVRPPQAILDVFQTKNGGLYFRDKYHHHEKAIFGIYNSEFSNANIYNYGGIQAEWLFSTSLVFMVTLKNCTIQSNIGNYGAGVYFSARVSLESSLPKLNIIDVSVRNNSLTTGSDVLFGAMFLQNFNVTIQNLDVSDNLATGIVSLGSKLNFNGLDNVFSNNTGVLGGGLALYESSFIAVEDQTYIEFLDNIAIRGGAIFVSSVNHGSMISLPCFFQQGSSNTNPSDGAIFFDGNNAVISGSVLYGDYIDQCYSGARFSKLFNYTLQHGNSVISSDPLQICYCTNNNPDCTIYEYAVSVVPGETVTIPVVAVGQRNGITQGVLQMTDYNTPIPTITLFTLDAQCSYLNYTVNVIDLNQTSLDIYVTLEGVVDPINDISRNLLYITLEQCPEGFAFDSSSGQCQCDPILLGVEFVTCDINTDAITRNGNIWIGYNNESNCTIIRQVCPFDYCLSSSVTFNISEPDSQCNLGRAGVYCGECAEGLSLMLGSNRCGECSSAYLTLTVVFILAGLGLVAILLSLNLTVSTGTINGLIFYANIVKINEEIYFPNGTIPVLSQFISWLNLDFGIETCYFNGMTALHKAWFQFVFPLYIWIIIIILIISARYSTKISKLLGNNALSVLATLILLSYSKIFRAIIYILNGSYVFCGSSWSLVWYTDPNVLYHDAHHLVLSLVASVFLLLLALPYTLTLLFNHQISLALNSDKCHVFGCHSQKLGIRLFFRAYTAPFEKRFYFWTGLLLLVRFLLVFIVAFGKNTGHAPATITIVGFVLTLMISFGNVYEKRLLNILEAWFMLNILFITAFSVIDEGYIVTIISTTLALITAIGILVVHVYWRLKQIRKIENLLNKCKNLLLRKRVKLASIRKLSRDSPPDVAATPEKIVRSTSIELIRRETLISDDIVISNTN